MPKIGGQSETYLRNALTEYGTGKRKHPTMQAQAESFSQQDIADIAARCGYSSVPAFTRRFSTLFGIGPAQWRRRSM